MSVDTCTALCHSDVTPDLPGRVRAGVNLRKVPSPVGLKTSPAGSSCSMPRMLAMPASHSPTRQVRAGHKTGQGSAQDRSGQGTRQVRIWQKTGQDRAQDRSGQGTRQARTSQDRTQDRSGQGTSQVRTGHKTGQDRAQDRSGQGTRQVRTGHKTGLGRGRTGKTRHCKALVASAGVGVIGCMIENVYLYL